MKQASLFDKNYRNTDPETSKTAALANPDGRLILKQRVLQAHRRFWRQGLTDHELAEWLGHHQGSCAKRRGELVEEGLIEDSGTTRPSNYRTPMIVWRVVRSEVLEVEI